MCNRFQSGGMPLVEIRHYVELVAAGPGNELERRNSCGYTRHESKPN